MTKPQFTILLFAAGGYVVMDYDCTQIIERGTDWEKHQMRTFERYGAENTFMCVPIEQMDDLREAIQIKDALALS